MSYRCKNWEPKEAQNEKIHSKKKKRKKDIRNPCHYEMGTNQLSPP